MRVLQLNDLYDPRIGSSVRQMYTRDGCGSWDTRPRSCP
jgi:hypothetical protein